MAVKRQSYECSYVENDVPWPRDPSGNPLTQPISQNITLSIFSAGRAGARPSTSTRSHTTSQTRPRKPSTSAQSSSRYFRRPRTIVRYARSRLSLSHLVLRRCSRQTHLPPLSSSPRSLRRHQKAPLSGASTPSRQPSPALRIFCTLESERVGSSAWEKLHSRPVSVLDYFAVRARFLILEAFFAFVFFVLESTHYDKPVAGLVAWSRSEVAWGPLCTYTSLREKPQGQRFKSEKQALFYLSKRRERRLERARLHTRKWRAHQLATNKEEYLRRGAANKMRSRLKDPKRDKATMARFQKRAKEAKHFYYEPCDQTFSSIGALELHRTREVHLGVIRILAGSSKKVLDAQQRRNRDWRIRNPKTFPYRASSLLGLGKSIKAGMTSNRFRGVDVKGFRDLEILRTRESDCLSVRAIYPV